MHKTRILVVDDEPEIVETLKHCLTVRGYEAEGALSVAQALQSLAEKQADVILLDLKMPGLDGADFAKIVRQRYPEIKIIMVTAYPDAASSLYNQNLLEALFTKPVQFQELYTAIVSLEERIKKEVKTTILSLKMKLFTDVLRTNVQNYKFN